MTDERVGEATPATDDAPASRVYPSSRARRPIGIFYDEFSRGKNPFALIETCGVADVTDPPERIVELFDRFGIVKIRRAHSPERTAELHRTCIDFSGLRPLDFRDVFARRTKWATGGDPALNDRRFWPFVVDPGLKAVLDGVLGTRTFEFGSAVAVHYSARGLHRDYRPLVEDPSSPYSFKDPRKRIVRVLHYCGHAGGALGYIPFSHDERAFLQQSKRIGLTHPTEWFDRHRAVLTQARLQRDFVEADEIERHVCWVHADPGDLVVSNSAMLHCGEYLTGPRYFFVTTYADSDPDTLDWAMRETTPLSHAYYEFLLERGFGGAADVLEALDAAGAVG